MNERELRIGANEALFRAVNDQVENVNRALATMSRRMVIVCECGRQDCLERLDLSIEEYEDVRSDSALFAIAPEHEFPDVETVVERTPSYWVVRKRPGGPQQVAEATDPRR